MFTGTDDPCYRCTSFDEFGRGFIEADDNPGLCGHYKECWRNGNTGVLTSLDRWCPPGTWTDPEDIHRGAPCTSTTCNITMCDDCGIPTASTPAICEWTLIIIIIIQIITFICN